MTDETTTPKASFLPFHALNEFMRPDFRLTVVRTTLNALSTLPMNIHNPIGRLTKQFVKVPGFRHSDKAPVPVRIFPTASAFEKSPEMVAAILAAWAETKADLRQKVFDLLHERGWKLLTAESIQGLNPFAADLAQTWGVLPIEIDRTKLPGFLSLWPKGEEFETLYNAFNAAYPEATYSQDEVSLMVVWLALRLPYAAEEEETEETAK